MAVKQTYLYKGGLKPGTYFLQGKDNKVANGNLMFERIIGDFLTAKGLATTEDNCTFNWNCCSDFTFEYNSETGQLCLTLGGEEECIDVLSALNANNALTGAGTVIDPLQWGGDLIENTTVDGNDTYNVTFQDLTQFLVTVLGATAGGTLRVSGLASLPAFLRHRNPANDVWMTIDLDFNNVSTFGYQDSNGLIGFRIFPDETDVENELALRTKRVRDGLATNGEALLLTDAVEGKCEWGPVPGGTPTIPGPYEDDADAGTNLVSVGSPYYLDATNPYGMPEGMVKVRIS